MNVIIFGRGKLGRALATQLRRAEVDVSLRQARGTANFRRSGAGPCVVILAVPDPHIRGLAEALAPHIGRHDVVLHCAGSRDAQELSACAARGANVAGFHPLVSFASVRNQPSLAGATFVVSGDGGAVRSARWLCRRLESHCIVAPVLGPAYHAAAALLANGSAALSYAAVEILRDLGIDQREAERALAGLLASVAFNVRAVGVPDALTGPVARGDRATVRAHQAALKRLSCAHEAAYAELQPSIERCARARSRPGSKRQRQK